jgi:peptide/nickel transport system permease protein
MNLEGTLFVIVSLEMAHAILLEAALSFLGFRAQPSTASWG